MTIENHDENQQIFAIIVDGECNCWISTINYLKYYGINAIIVSCEQEMVDKFTRQRPDLVILALRRSHTNGLRLLSRLRSDYNLPVIVTTGDRMEESDRVVGLDLGADDYIMKPFGPRELVARIRAILRRRRSQDQILQRSRRQKGFKFGEWRLDICRRRLVGPDGRLAALTKREFALLLAFLQAPQQSLSREHLARSMGVPDILDRTIDLQVLRLRRKLAAGSEAERVIWTDRGIGYVFLLPVQMLWEKSSHASKSSIS